MMRILTEGELGQKLRSGELVETIDTNDGVTRHQAAYIYMPFGVSIAAISICGDAFGLTDGLVRGWGDPASVSCPRCLRQRELEEREATR